MELNSNKALKILNNCRGLAPDDNWINHSICVGDTAFVIAEALNLDGDYAKTLGYLHDIGKRFGFDGLLAHAAKGYYYILDLGYSKEYASICLTHSFLNNDINCVAGGIPKKDGFKYEFIKEYIENHQQSIYEKIINLCDLMCKEVNMTLDGRLNEIIGRHGTFENTQYHINEAKKLKKYFDNLLGYDVEDLFFDKEKKLKI